MRPLQIAHIASFFHCLDRYRKQFLLTCILTALCTSAMSQQPLVYPGDANKDGRCDNEDILAIGLGHGQTGPQRVNPSINWVPQIATPWPVSLPQTGINFSHVDCNGDGAINDQDTTAVDENYYETHSNSQSTTRDTVNLNGKKADLRFSPTTSTVQDGDTLTIDIFSESPGYPNLPDTVYGMSFTVEYDTSVIKDKATTASVYDSWIGDTSQTVHTAQIVDSSMAQKKGWSNEEIGRADYAISRTDQNNTDGSGNIATISIVMEDDLHLIPNFDSLLVVRFSNITVITNEEKRIRVNSVNDTVNVQKKKTGIAGRTDERGNGFRVYPNPASEQLHIDMAHDIEARQVELYNRQGELVQQRAVEQRGQLSLAVDDVPTGVYFLQITSDEGVYSRQVMIGR
ncbi:MAG: hypothetical protein BRD50_01615 [Bacteroidetes bacterium SW_11_45_7]|nr:MAG: hypothetical protein BRD50_01615 [Bacteroidetes bacterium SW_11_45_7]